MSWLNRSGLDPWSVLATTTALTMWAFLGVESATVPAAAVRDPARNVPRATLAGTVIAILATVTACTAVSALLPLHVLARSSAPFADAAAAIWGGAAGRVFAAAAAIACFGALNGWVLIQGQVPLAAARDGVFPAIFDRVDRNGTPLTGLFASSVLASLLVLDLSWIMGIARPWYQAGIGHLMAAEPALGAALAFYLLYPAGLLWFGVSPGAATPGPGAASARGAAFGFFCYATYDLTNLATLRDWPVWLALLDLGWGTAVSAACAALGHLTWERRR